MNDIKFKVYLWLAETFRKAEIWASQKANKYLAKVV